MSERVAVVGSRRGCDLERVERWVRTLHEKYPDTILVSGGADGVDHRAEQTWLSLGGVVVSFRPVQVNVTAPEPLYAVERWDLGAPYPTAYILPDWPTWANYASAAFSRDMLIAEFAEKGVAFWDGRSAGTGLTIECFRNENKPIYVYKEGRDVPES